MKLEEYITLEEKAPFFVNGNSAIDVNIDKIFTNIEDFLKQGDSFFFVVVARLNIDYIIPRKEFILSKNYTNK